MNNVYYIEDCLIVLAGMHPSVTKSFDILKSDKTLVYSLGRQVSNEVALTDRQYELSKEKLTLYAEQLLEVGVNVKQCLDKLRFPLRSIDRSQYISLEELNNELKICIRFPFNKSKIVALEEMRSSIPTNEYYHDKGSHKHYFTFNEHNAYTCVDAWKDRNFTIDSTLLEFYNKLVIMNNNKENYISGVYQFKLKNLKDKAVSALISDVGDAPNQSNLALYKDREELYGLKYFDEADLEKSLRNLSTLTQKIVNRKHPNIFVNSKHHSLDKLIYSLWELNRFPILVFLDGQCPLEKLHEFHNSVSALFNDNEQTVLFRADNDTADNIEFNAYIKNNNLNNKLDKNIKIVYINNTKIPKTLFQTEWMPKAIFCFSNSYSASRNALMYTSYDLVIHYDTNRSPTLASKLGIDNI